MYWHKRFGNQSISFHFFVDIVYKYYTKLVLKAINTRRLKLELKNIFLFAVSHKVLTIKFFDNKDKNIDADSLLFQNWSSFLPR